MFTHLKGIKRLNIGFCTQLIVPPPLLMGCEWLGMWDHPKNRVKEARDAGFDVKHLRRDMFKFQNEK